MIRTEHQPLVIGLGECLWDLLPSGKVRGGAPANVAFHVTQLGCNGVLASAVGDDELGRELTDELRALGLSTQYVQVLSTHPTGTVQVHLSPDGQPGYTIAPDVAWDALVATDALLELASKADCICVGTLAQRSRITRETIRGVLASARRDCLKVFDINLRQGYFDVDILARGCDACEVVKLNDQEWSVFCDAFGFARDIETGLPEFRRRYDCQVVALTCGADGSVVCSAEGFDVLRGVDTPIVDTIGAGDAFTAGIISGLLRHESISVLHTKAARLARYVCTQRGATPLLPDELLNA
jgi:fructokinase